MAAVRNYGGITAADRRSQRRTALMDAAWDVLVEHGASAVTKTAVCQRANLNDRYFYEHFANRDALLETLVLEMTRDGVAATTAAVRAAAPNQRARVHAAAQAAVAFVIDDARCGAILLSAPTIEVLHNARLSAQRTITSAMSTLIRELGERDAIDPHNADMVSYTLVSGTLELVTAWLRGEFAYSREHLAEVVSAMLLSATDIVAQLPGSHQ